MPAKEALMTIAARMDDSDLVATIGTLTDIVGPAKVDEALKETLRRIVNPESVEDTLSDVLDVNPLEYSDAYIDDPYNFIYEEDPEDFTLKGVSMWAIDTVLEPLTRRLASMAELGMKEEVDACIAVAARELRNGDYGIVAESGGYAGDMADGLEKNNAEGTLSYMCDVYDEDLWDDEEEGDYRRFRIFFQRCGDRDAP